MRPLISIIIATFNSARTLPLVINSIHKQIIPKNKLEILIIDGGSTDDTLKIAKNNNCSIYKNERVEPVNAKLLGYKYAKGGYIVYLDADEVIENPNSLLLKYKLLKINKEIKAVIGSGYRNPSHAKFLTKYINEFGDPFSYFIYKLSKNSNYYYPALKKLFPVIKENSEFVIFDFSKNGIDLLHELGAANSMLDRDFLKEEFPNLNLNSFAHLFQALISKSKFIGMIKNDAVIHYSTSDLRSYLNKINWRIKNNIYHLSSLGISGFWGREKFHSNRTKIKKYLYIPYAFTFIFPLLDSLQLAISRKEVTYLLHLFLTVYSAIMILWYYLLKVAGVRMKPRSYDESIQIPTK